MSTKILIIDDDPVSLTTLSSILSKAGFTTIQSHGGKDALSKLGLKNPHIIICDINMPGMDGVDVFTTLKDQDETRNIPFFVTSSLTHMENNFMAVGAAGFIKKPFDREQLVAQIQDYVSTSLTKQENF